MSLMMMMIFKIDLFLRWARGMFFERDIWFSVVVDVILAVRVVWVV